jgi:hypothetical protein
MKHTGISAERFLSSPFSHSLQDEKQDLFPLFIRYQITLIQYSLSIETGFKATWQQRERTAGTRWPGIVLFPRPVRKFFKNNCALPVSDIELGYIYS